MKFRRQKNSQREQSAQGSARVQPAHASGTHPAQDTWQTQGMRQTPGALQTPSVSQVSGMRPVSGVGQSQGTLQKPIVQQKSTAQHKSTSRAQGAAQAAAARKKISKRRRITGVLGVLVLLVGMCVFAYPIASNYLFQQTQSELVIKQAEAVSSTSQETLDAMYAEAVDYNERLFNSRTVITDPFDADTQAVTDEEYESLLNLNGNGVMATITIPAIDAELVIYHGTTDEVLEKGVGHMQGSSLPVGGESTHVVLAGHTGLPSGQIFDNIDQLEVGDYFIITVLGEELAYRITSIETVLPEETDSLVIQEGEDLVTLVTCTPYGVNSHRLLVHAERCEIPDEWLEGDTTVTVNLVDRTLLPSILIGLALAALIIALARLIAHLRARRAAKQAAKQAPFAGEVLRRSAGGGVDAAGGGAGVVSGAVRDMGSVLPRTDAGPAQSGAAHDAGPAQPGATRDAGPPYGGGA